MSKTIFTDDQLNTIQSNGAKYIHIGGDEVIYGCWAEDASITSFMSVNNIPNYDSLLNYFVQRADDIVLKLNRYSYYLNISHAII